MKTRVQTTWIASILLIVGLIVGYSAFVAEHGNIASAASECPCANGDCSHHS